MKIPIVIDMIRASFNRTKQKLICKCSECMVREEFPCTTEQWNRIDNGAKAYDVLSNLDADDWYFISYGICPACYKSLFGEMEE